MKVGPHFLLALCKPCSSFSVLTIGFDSAQYTVAEGDSETITVSVTSSDISLDREVVVNIMGIPAELPVDPVLTFSSGTLTPSVTLAPMYNMASDDAVTVSISLAAEDDPTLQLSPGTATLTISDTSKSHTVC